MPITDNTYLTGFSYRFFRDKPDINSKRSMRWFIHFIVSNLSHYLLHQGLLMFLLMFR